MAHHIDAFTSRVRGAHRTVLDVGCGPGWWVQEIQRAGLQAVGLDLTPGFLRGARSQTGLDVFVAGTVTALPFETASFDGALCWYVLHHLPDEHARRALHEIRRVVRPGAPVLIGGRVGEAERIKTQGYGGISVRLLLRHRSADWWRENVTGAGFVVRAQALIDVADPARAWQALHLTATP